MRRQMSLNLTIGHNFIKLLLLILPFYLFTHVGCGNTPRMYYTFIIDTSQPLDKDTSNRIASYLNEYVFTTIKNAEDKDPWIELKEICDPDADNFNFSTSLKGIFQAGTGAKNLQLEPLKAMQKKPELAGLLLSLGGNNFYNVNQRAGAVSPVYDTILTTIFNNQKNGRTKQKYIIISDFLDNYIDPEFNKNDLNADQQIFNNTYGQKFEKFLDPAVEIEVIHIRRRDLDPLLTKNAEQTSNWIFSSQYLYKTDPQVKPSFQYLVSGLPIQN